MSDQHEIHHHHHEAAKHLDEAARHHREAAKHAETGQHEKASHHAHLAHGHKLHAIEHAIVPDRIEAGTFMVAAALTRGDVLIRDCLPMAAAVNGLATSTSCGPATIGSARRSAASSR